MERGRPTDYSQEILDKSIDYLAECKDDRESKIVRLPTRGGLAKYLGVSRDTLYEWAKVHKDFSYIMEQLGAEQEDRLINSGLAGTYNPTIAKVLLTKHGYREGSDITTNDKDLPTPILGNVSTDNSNQEGNVSQEAN